MSEQIAYIGLEGNASSLQAVMTAAVLYGVKSDTNTTKSLLSAQRKHTVGEGPLQVCPQAAFISLEFRITTART